MKNLRIFISSPGDVRQERLIAKKVIAELNRIYGAYVHLEPIMWEDLPLEATSSFQQGIDYFVNEAPVDIAVFILWSRLGSTLGRSFMKSDGTEYSSGTEYEYDTMYALWKQTGRPKIMVYVKDSEPQFGNGLSHKDIKESLEQHERLNNFIEEKFRDRETGTNYTYWQFDKQATFEERLKIHLSRLVREHIGKDVIIKEWDGNPYRGLQSFGIKESLIFCGRRELAYDVLGKLIPGAESTEVESLLVLGESGSGKSSFVMAGLIPLIYSNDEDLLNKGVFKCCPSDFNGAVYQGIYDIVRRMFPQLCGNPALDKLGEGIPDNYDSQYLHYALKTNSSDTVPTLVIDQFEEMFSDSSITEDERLRTLSLLNILVQTRQVRTVVIMRNDFYSKFTTYPTLGAIKQACVTVDVPNASVASLADIIEEPARKADIHWEVNEQGMSLSRVIIQDAVKVNSLPLIEFALSELYNECADNGIMTFEAYGRIGRIRGAVAQYANRVYEALDDSEKAAFADLLSCVVTVSDDKDVRYVRKTSLRSAAEKTSVHKALLDKLISAHLFTSGKDAGGGATFTITHEMLISSWDAVKSWVDDEAEFIEKNDYYERLAKHWDSNGRKKKDLLYERSVLLEAEYFMFKNERKLLPPTFDFIDRSLKAQRRKGVAQYVVGFVFMILIFAACVMAKFAGTTGDQDMDDMFSFKDITWLSLLSFAIPLTVTVGNAMLLRMCPRYTYKTIKRTAYLWGMVIAFMAVDTWYEWSDGWIFQVLWLIMFAFAGISVLFEFYRRRLWIKSIFKPYVFTDKFGKIRDIVISSIIGLFVLFMLGYYGVLLSDKNERYEKTLEVADTLFEGLNNIQSQLSWSDKLYINELRRNYLRERFADQLNDTVPDEREWEYAQCLYNLHEPYSAAAYLYPDHRWNDHLLFVMCMMKIGNTEAAEFALELYLESGRYDKFNDISTSDLIWTAEKLDRFDLAERVYDILDSIQIDWRSTMPAAHINYGHIELSKGNRTAAYEFYDKAKTLCKKMMGSDEVISTSLAQDLYLFQWLDVCDSAEVSAAMAHYGFKPRKFYTRLDEESGQLTSDVMARLAGEWVNGDSTMVMKYNDRYPLCQYRCYQTALDSEWIRILTNYRCSTDSDGALFIEELNQDSNEFAISTGEIVKLTDDELVLRVIENGNDTDRGTYRRFTKMVSNE